MNNLVLSVEKLNDISICPRLYNYKHNLRKTPISKPDYLEEGELIHEGLRLYYQSVIEGEKITTSVLLDLIRNYAATKLNLASDKIEQVCKDLAMYCNYYVSESWEIESAEEPFAKILHVDEKLDLTLVLNGKIDLRIKTNYGKGPRVLVDHKYESQFREKLDRDNQALAYSWAYETKDWIYNRIGKQKSYEPEKRLQRPYFNYSQYQIDEWLQSAIEAGIDIYNREKSGLLTTPRFTGCTFYGLKCTFYDICNTSKDNQEYKLQTLFTNRDSKTVMET